MDGLNASTMFELAEVGIDVSKLSPQLIALLFPRGSSDPEVAKALVDRANSYGSSEIVVDPSGVALGVDELNETPKSELAQPNASHY